MAVDKSSFEAIMINIPIQASQVESIKVEIVADNVKTEGAVYITDVMLQGGSVATSHIGHVSEIRWSFENA